jgi:hypothetical protein
VTEETNNAIDQFLVWHYKTDLEDRYAALEAIRDGDIELCKKLTSEAMKRWVSYMEILSPYLSNSELLFAAYPQLDTGKEVLDALGDCGQPTNKTILDIVTRWKNWHLDQTRQIVTLVNKLRSEFHYDPWSPACGSTTDRRAMNIQQKMLRLSGKIREKILETIQLINSVCQETQ